MFSFCRLSYSESQKMTDAPFCHVAQLLVGSKMFHLALFRFRSHFLASQTFFCVFLNRDFKPFLTVFLAHIFLNSFLAPAIFNPLSLFDFGTGMFPSVHWHLAHVGNFKTEFFYKKIQKRIGILEFFHILYFRCTILPRIS